ncbi:hypothetical protein [Frankia sp. CiP3]|uniref:hypothetical protein n=1 Tax=Frankia sp. CiP3 TaxID=2880971 RepID=UPI001EF732FE|nr:hypothetical protein [Frankia sp. CiP3]
MSAPNTLTCASSQRIPHVVANGVSVQFDIEELSKIVRQPLDVQGQPAYPEILYQHGSEVPVVRQGEHAKIAWTGRSAI